MGSGTCWVAAVMTVMVTMKKAGTSIFEGLALRQALWQVTRLPLFTESSQPPEEVRVHRHLITQMRNQMHRGYMTFPGAHASVWRAEIQTHVDLTPEPKF